MTLKIRSRSPKLIQLFIMSKCYIRANRVKIRQLVHEILCIQAPFGSNLEVCPSVTLQNRSRSPKPNQLSIMSQCYIHANLVEICRPLHELRCTQALFGLNLAVTLKIRSRSRAIVQTRKCHANANANADASRIRTKNNMPPSPSVGDIMNE